MIARCGTVPASHNEARELDAPGTGVPVTRTTLAVRALLEQRTIHAHDMAAAVQTEFPNSRELQLKAAPETQSASIIALTAHAMSGGRATALAAGYDTKLIELPRRLDTIEWLLQGAAAHGTVG